MSHSTQVARRAGIVALGTLSSRVLGMLRESVIAASFSVSATDAFFIAFTIPNTLRMLLGEGAVSNAFVPVFSDVRARRGEQEARTFSARFAGTLGALLAVATVLGMLGAPLLAWAYAGGLAEEPESFALVVSLTRWLFPFLLLAGMAALATGVLNVLGHYAVPAFAPVLLNVAMIAAPFALVPVASALGLPFIMTLALGALVGGVLQLVAQLPALRARHMLPRPELGFRDPDVRRGLGLMGPLVLGLGVYQLNMMLSRLFASFLPAGSQSYLNYGQRVIEVPQGMFALAVASAALPTLARLRSEQKHDELLALFRYSMRLTMFVAIPSSVLLCALAEPTSAVLFGRGIFTAHHVHETARSLAFQALGVWAVALVRTVVPMFAAHGDTRTPVKASAVNLLVFLSLSALLMGAFDHVAIAVGNSVAAAVQLMVLLWALRKHTGPLGLRALLVSALRITLASVGMGLALWAAARAIDWEHARELVRASYFLALCAVGGVIFLVLARLFRSPELGELLDAVRRRRKRAT
jgi:putative peptidoglycan lipid II flippase